MHVTPNNPLIGFVPGREITQFGHSKVEQGSNALNLTFVRATAALCLVRVLMDRFLKWAGHRFSPWLVRVCQRSRNSEAVAFMRLCAAL